VRIQPGILGCSVQMFKRECAASPLFTAKSTGIQPYLRQVAVHFPLAKRESAMWRCPVLPHVPYTRVRDQGVGLAKRYTGCTVFTSARWYARYGAWLGTGPSSTPQFCSCQRDQCCAAVSSRFPGPVTLLNDTRVCYSDIDKVVLTFTVAQTA
jgi:hypothetical protein